MSGSEEMETAIKAAREAGRILMSWYGRTHVTYKKDRSIATEADLESERTIKSILTQAFPEHSFLGEESGLEKRDGEYTWVVDPLDGTTNYTIKNPYFAVSIALVHREEPVLGVVYYPVAEELFTGEKGKGAALNGREIEVSKKEVVGESVVTFCNNRSESSIRRMARIFLDMKLVTNKLRQLGAGALELCYVASGRTESFLTPDVNPWDVAAGTVIVREAGGMVTDFEGRPFTTASRDILASNGLVHRELLEIVKGK